MTITAQHRKFEEASAFRRVVLPALIVVIGLVVMLYPVISSNWNNIAQQKVAQEYEDLIQDADPVALNEAIEAAHEYNRTQVQGPILDPWLVHVNTDNDEYRAYTEQLAGQPAMSQVVIPTINSRLPVYHGTKADTLQKGLGHLYGTALPVGGDSTHSVITGHTGITNATLWDNLIKVKEGDAIYVSTFGERLKYEVHDIEVVLPHETDSIGKVSGEDLLTLITCTPYGINTHRLLVHAHRVEMDPDDGKVFESAGFQMQWWMWLVLAVAGLVLAGLVWWILRTLRNNKVTVENEELA
ncbi:class C sortase [Corynebacterium nasicanis]|uniref:Class C sortase n=1 Tax=Corynebacterium nasicanis TaxID=1448267 RepID=A0ABW1QE53_9CORY